jgi:PleD family two-component response regulator
MITEEVRPFHPPPFSYRILYAGNDHALEKYLQDELEDCQVVRCPNGSQARLFIKGINHSLLLFDELLPDATGEELERFTRSLVKREHTPVIIFKKSDDFELLASAITRLLAAQERDAMRNYWASDCWARGPCRANSCAY